LSMDDGEAAPASSSPAEAIEVGQRIQSVYRELESVESGSIFVSGKASRQGRNCEESSRSSNANKDRRDKAR